MPTAAPTWAPEINQQVVIKESWLARRPEWRGKTFIVTQVNRKKMVIKPEGAPDTAKGVYLDIDACIPAEDAPALAPVVPLRPAQVTEIPWEPTLWPGAFVRVVLPVPGKHALAVGTILVVKDDKIEKVNCVRPNATDGVYWRLPRRYVEPVQVEVTVK